MMDEMGKGVECRILRCGGLGGVWELGRLLSL
jgi:hypothetical protein